MDIDYGKLVKCSNISCEIHKLFFEHDAVKVLNHAKHHELYFNFKKSREKHKVYEGKHEGFCAGCSFSKPPDI